MAGTNKKNKALLSKPAIILKDPQLPENIGMTIRSLVNYGFYDLRIINPKLSWPNNKSVSSSAGAFDIIKNSTKTYLKLDKALHGVEVLFATSVRVRDLEKIVLTPKEAIQIIKSQYKSCSIGFLFGPEKAGLNNNDLSEANYIIKIPTNPSFGSLNLAMAVNIICYEWFTCFNEYDASNILKSKHLTDKKKMISFKDFLINTLHEVKFFQKNNNQEKLKVNLKNIFSKSKLTDKELLMLYGVIKSLKNYKNK